MGDRGLICFTTVGTYGKGKGKTFYSPGIYLHWRGAPEEVKELLDKASAKNIKGRSSMNKEQLIEALRKKK